MPLVLILQLLHKFEIFQNKKFGGKIETRATLEERKVFMNSWLRTLPSFRALCRDLACLSAERCGYTFAYVSPLL